MGKEIFIDPFRPEQLNPNSYNLTLHNELLIYENRKIDLAYFNIRINPDGLDTENLQSPAAGESDIAEACCFLKVITNAPLICVDVAI